MQLTQALTLVPERTREDKEEKGGAAHVSMDKIVEFLTGPERDVPLIEFDLPKIFDFYSKKGKDDSEVVHTMGGIRKLLNDSWTEEGEESLLEELIDKVVSSGVRRLGVFIAKMIWGTIWRITKWLVKEVVAGVIKNVLRYLVVPALEAMVEFMFTPVGLAIALTGGAIAAGYLIYKAFFEDKTEVPTQDKKTIPQKIESIAADILLGGDDSSSSAQAPQAPQGSTTVASAPRTSQGSLTTGAAAPVGAGEAVAAGAPPDDVKKMIIQHEGVKLQPYKDSLGLWTVGVGHLIGDGKSLPPEYNRTFTMAEVYALFDKDFDYHKKAAMNIPNFSRLGAKAQGAFIDLTFNMGPGWFKRWPKLVQAMKDFNVAAVIDNLRTSKWAKQVQSSRVSDILSLLSTELSGTSAASQTPKMTPGVTTAATTQNQVKDAVAAARPGVTVTPPSSEKTIIKTPSGQLVAANMN